MSERRFSFLRRASRGALLLWLLVGRTSLTEASPGETSRTAGRAPHSPVSRVTDSETSAHELRLLTLAVNQHRVAIGCKPLIWDERLARLARKYCEAMASGGFFGHYDPAGVGPFERMRNAGIRYRAAGENLAVGQTKGIQVFGDWLDSPEHRKILESPLYTHHGIGFYRNRWSHLFVRYESGEIAFEVVPISPLGKPKSHVAIQ